MRLAAVALALAAALGGGATAARLDAAGRTARLHLADAAPVKVRGAGFAARERVRLTVRSGEVRKTKVVLATTAGRFQVTFPGLVLDRCSGFFASAVGSRGSRTGLKLPQPLCPPPR
jgi:hypothetical protein